MLWLILFINLAARSWKECSERIFSGCPYGDTTTRVSGPWLVAGIEWSARCSGDALISNSGLVNFKYSRETAFRPDFRPFGRSSPFGLFTRNPHRSIKIAGFICHFPVPDRCVESAPVSRASSWAVFIIVGKSSLFRPPWSWTTPGVLYNTVL